MSVERILGFCEALRKNGVRAAEQEVIDCFRALALDADGDMLAGREQALAVFAATLAKSTAEEEILERVFALHFGFALDAAAGKPLAALLRERGLGEEDIAAVLRELEGADLVGALAAGDAARLTELVREALEESDLSGLQSPLQIAYFTSRVLTRLGHTGVEERLMRARAALLPGDAARDRALASAAWELQERLRRTARRAVELEHDKRTVARPARKGSLLDRDLRAVRAEEVEELRALVRRLAEKLKARLVIRRRRSRRGRLDIRRILRASVATDAVPMRVHLQRKRPERPDVILLCDVSDSVRQASLFMLELVGAVSDVLRRARSFVFVDRIGEVTSLFASRAGDPVEAILGGDVVPVGANSDYGRAFRAFWDACGGQLTRKTTVVILGDGRSNYRPPEDWILGEVRRRSRRVLWLSPEDRGTWGFGDSEMVRYARHADAIFVVRSASDLARAIDRIAR